MMIEKGLPSLVRTLLNFSLAFLPSLAALAAALAFLAMMLPAYDSFRTLTDAGWWKNQRNLCVRKIL